MTPSEDRIESSREKDIHVNKALRENNSEESNLFYFETGFHSELYLLQINTEYI